MTAWLFMGFVAQPVLSTLFRVLAMKDAAADLCTQLAPLDTSSGAPSPPHNFREHVSEAVAKMWKPFGPEFEAVLGQTSMQFPCQGTAFQQLAHVFRCLPSMKLLRNCQILKGPAAHDWAWNCIDAVPELFTLVGLVLFCLDKVHQRRVLITRQPAGPTRTIYVRHMQMLAYSFPLVQLSLAGCLSLINTLVSIAFGSRRPAFHISLQNGSPSTYILVPAMMALVSKV